MSEEKKDGIFPVATSPSIDEGQMAAEKQMRDIGADLYLEVRQYTREELDAERKIVLRKIDWVIMPMVSPSLSFEEERAHFLTRFHECFNVGVCESTGSFSMSCGNLISTWRLQHPHVLRLVCCNPRKLTTMIDGLDS
jgi:hypothetical protein